MVYIRQRNFSFIQSEKEIVECSKSALFCGDFCNSKQAIILVVLVLVSLCYLYIKVL